MKELMESKAKIVKQKKDLKKKNEEITKLSGKMKNMFKKKSPV